MKKKENIENQIESIIDDYAKHYKILKKKKKLKFIESVSNFLLQTCLMLYSEKEEMQNNNKRFMKMFSEKAGIKNT